MSGTIARIEATPFSLPLARASRWGKWGRRAAQDHVLIRVEDTDGAWGVAEATPRPSIYGESPASVVHAAEEHYAPLVTGCNPHDAVGIAECMAAVPRHPACSSAIDLAVHDLCARRHGITLAELLGAEPRPVPITYMLALRDREETIEEAEEISARFAVTSFKVKLGGDPSADRALLEELRTRLPPEWTLTADANGLYRPEQAAGLRSALAGMRVSLLEDPFPTTGLSEGPAEASLEAGVVADEAMLDAGAAHRAVTLAGVSAVCIKPPRTGARGSADVAAVAHAAGKTCWVGSQGVSGLGALLSAHVAMAVHSSPVPADLGTFLRQSEDAELLDEPVALKDGAIVPPRSPGSGARVDPDRLARFRTEVR